MTTNGTAPLQQVDPARVASLGLRLLERVAITRAERDQYDLVEALLVAIAQGRGVLVSPEEAALVRQAPATAPDVGPPPLDHKSSLV
jgi:hypothetical protein